MVQDVPPFCLVQGDRARISGLNVVGLRRSGLKRESISSIKNMFKILYNDNLTLDNAIETIAKDVQESEQKGYLPRLLAQQRKRSLSLKRPSYFISGRSQSADVLAAELILAIRERFSRVEGFGIVGPTTVKTRIPELASLEDCIFHSFHQEGGLSPEASVFRSELIEKLDDLEPQVAIFVGYSKFHHDWLSTSTGEILRWSCMA